jgi:flagellar secretion chaperone FliS
MAGYREHALEGASAVDLVVALYDGMIRFLYSAIAAVERGDIDGRRRAVKRAMDIIIHLQARLRMDVGGRPAQVLSEFYASTFALILQASQSASKAKFERAIACVREVRDAWREVARGPQAGPTSSAMAPKADLNPEAAGGAGWTA